ncbi:MAG TPA: hypothetical protein VFG87_09205 [Amycolatopsis sp.]|nr:hypothetical protein [Amycolatopsis sp.]
MISQPTQVDDLRLVALPSAVNCAEMFVRFALVEWSLKPLIDDATLVMRHIVKSSVSGATSSRPQFLTIRLRLHGDCFVMEVDDDQFGEPPELRGFTISAVSLPGGRRNVWCELPLTGGIAAALPRRAPGRSAARQAIQPPGVEAPKVEAPNFDDYMPEPALDTSDSEFLQRILYGLNRSTNGQPS